MWNKASETKPSAQGSAAPATTNVDVKPEIKSEIKPEAKLEVPNQKAIQTTPVPSAAQASPEPVSTAAPAIAPAVKSTAAPSAPTTIGAGLKIKGELTGNSDLFIDGEAQGAIVLPGSKVTIGSNGRVMADIDAREIIVEGTVQGNLKASDGVHLSASSVVKGTVLTPRITIKDGAHLSARVEMARAKGSREDSSSSGSALVSDSEPRTPLAARAESA